MAIEPIISWNAPSHLHMEKTQDWYWGVGIVTLAITVACFLFGNVIPGIFVIIAAVALVVHASLPTKEIICQINDRGIVVDGTLYPFLTLDSFWVAHEEEPARLILKSRKLMMPLIIIFLGDADPERIREVLLKYIAETEHVEPFLKLMLERFGF